MARKRAKNRKTINDRWKVSPNPMNEVGISAVRMKLLNIAELSIPEFHFSQHPLTPLCCPQVHIGHLWLKEDRTK